MYHFSLARAMEKKVINMLVQTSSLRVKRIFALQQKRELEGPLRNTTWGCGKKGEISLILKQVASL